MKTAKKVLSVILAVMLVVGTVTVAASAVPLTDDQSVNFSLRAQVFDTDGSAVAELKEQGTEWQEDVNAVTDAQDEDILNFESDLMSDEYCEDEVIEVKPGQVVWITTWITTEGDLYPGTINTNILYTHNIFLSCCNKNYNAVEPFDSVDLFTKNTRGTIKGGSTSAGAQSLRLSVPGLTEEQAQTWHYASQLYKIDAKAPRYAPSDVDEAYCSFPLWVDTDAVPGTIGYVRFAGIDGLGKLNQVIGYPGGDKSDTTAWMITDSADNFTYDGGILTFKVVGDAPALDYTALDAAIGDYNTEANNGGEDLYTEESWNAATKAYNDALTAKTEATTQDDIDDAAAALNDALENLEEIVELDWDRLCNDLDTLLPELSANYYTTSSYYAYSDAYAAAEDALDTATTQEEIDAAADDLEEAFDGLTLKADTRALQNALDQAENVDTTDWTDDSIKALDDAVAAGEAIMSQADEVSDQTAVDNAKNAILNALEGEIAKADYTAVDAQVEAAAAVVRDNFTAASVADLDDAVTAVEYGLPKSQQTAVDAMAKAIEDAIAALKPIADTTALENAIAAAADADEEDYAADIWGQIQDKVATGNTYIGAGLAAEDVQETVNTLAEQINALLDQTLGAADYTEVDKALASIPDDLSIYTDESVAVLDEATDAVIRDLKEDKQDEVNAMADAINAAVTGLTIKGADYTLVDKYVSQAANVDRALYTEDSLSELDSALAQVQPGFDVTHQDEVDGWANDICYALDNLEYKDADYTAVEAAKDKFADIDKDLYTEESVKDVEDAIAAVVEGKTADEQDEVDAMAKAIEDAIDALQKLGADYTAVDAAIEKANGLTQKNYVDFSAVTAAISAVVRGKTADEQAAVDEMAQAIYDAIDALVMKDADYKILNTLLPKLPTADKEDEYTAESWAALQEALDAVEYGLKIDRQADVTAMTKAVNDAYKALVPAGPADYTAVDAAIAKADGYDADDYTNFGAVEDAIADVIRGLNENHQDEVDAMADAINAAIDALQKQPADYTELDEFVDIIDEILAEIDDANQRDWYTGLEALEEALADAKEVARNLTIDDQAIIDDALAALKTAEAAVEMKPADYTALEDAIAAAEKVEKELYTEESVAVFEKALADAKDIEKDLLIDAQDKIDEAADALTEAKAALELKPTEPEEPTGFVTEATCEPTSSEYRNFTAKVENRAWKIQVVDKDGNTVTFDRDHAKVTSIVTYDANGNEVENPLSRDAAYEVWTVEGQYLKAGEYTIISKDSETGWEALEDGCPLVIENSVVYTDVISITPASTTVKRCEKFDVKVVTGKDVIKVTTQINGVDYKTFTPSGTDEDGNNVFNCFVAANVPGNTTATLTVKYKTMDGWNDCTDPSVELTVTK